MPKVGINGEMYNKNYNKSINLLAFWKKDCIFAP